MNDRFHTLDTLRGLACLQVVFGHCINSLPALNWMYDRTESAWEHGSAFYFAYSPLHIFLAGPEAVKLFFILSGFVLSLPFFKKDLNPKSYLHFFVKRIVRIYLPYAAILLIVLAVKETFYNPEATINFGYFVKGFLAKEYDAATLLQVFLLSGPVANLNPVLWTLPPEIKISLILPFFVVFFRKTSLWGSVVLALGVVVAYKTGLTLGISTYWPDYVTLYYLPFFLLGTIACKYRDPVMQWVNSLPTSMFYLFLLLCCVIYTFKFSCWWLPSPLFRLLVHYEDYVVALPSALFLIFSLSTRLRSILNHKSLLFVGKISFSLYLVHHIVVLSVVYLLGNFISEYLVIMISLCLFLPLAYLFYRGVEEPSMKLAKKAADNLLNLLGGKTHAPPVSINQLDPLTRPEGSIVENLAENNHI